MMCVCAGLVGPKTENVEKVLVFKAFLKIVEIDNLRSAGTARFTTRPPLTTNDTLTSILAMLLNPMKCFNFGDAF